MLSLTEVHGKPNVIDQAPSDTYALALAEYLRTRGEAALYSASRVSQQFIEIGIGPEDIVALHSEAFLTIVAQLNFKDQARATVDGMQFLLEAMIAFGVQYQQAMESRLREHVTRACIDRERADAAEKIVEEKGNLLDIVAHELRTPLTGVKGNLDLATRMVSQSRLESLPLVLSRAHSAVDHLGRVMYDLLEAGKDVKPISDRTVVDFLDVTAQACDWCAMGAADKNIVLERIDSEQPVTVLGDPGALLRVVINLLTNAIRYTPVRGSVSIRTYSTSVESVVEVRDTGIGIAVEEQHRIFDKFYRSPDAERVNTHGLGLGLAIVHRIALAHDGHVVVESVPGQGSTFRLILPSNPLDKEQKRNHV